MINPVREDLPTDIFAMTVMAAAAVLIRDVLSLFSCTSDAELTDAGVALLLHKAMRIVPVRGRTMSFCRLVLPVRNVKTRASHERIRHDATVARFSAVLRSSAFKYIFRSRSDFGVTSTNSSSSMNAIASSSDSILGGTI
jgi:hypothetical protein